MRKSNSLFSPRSDTRFGSARQHRPPPSRCPSSGGRLDRATIRSDSTPAARSWPVIRRKSDSTMRAALIYVVGSIAVFYLFYLFLH
jgi:hypothetical protein